MHLSHGLRVDNSKVILMKIIKKIWAASLVLFHASAMAIPTTEDGLLGLYDANSVRVATGQCKDCATLPQARWYFEHEQIAVSKGDVPMAGYSRSVNAQQDLASLELNALPPLIWVGSGQVLPEATITPDGKRLTQKTGGEMEFDLVPKIALNRSYWNDETLKFFTQRPVRLRGEAEGDKFVARTVWPLDFNISPEAELTPLASDESLKTLVQFEHGGAKSPYQARLLWERAPGVARQSPGKAVVSLMLNGAQGDDDEAHGGHFGVATGRFEQDGNYARWLLNNFYNLDSVSEKGIVAAVTPMDKYLMDLNNGQSYYRPSYMLVATFRDDQAAAKYQAAINRVYNHFYRHDFVYDHSRDNCAGISIDTFRTLGWHVPERGVEGYLKATAAYAYVGFSERSMEKGRKIYDYLTTETTRLYPAVAFDAMGNDLMALAQGKTGRELTSFEQELARNIEAIWFVRIPQIPSSRAYGQAPVYSFDQYMKQAPADRSQWQVVPTDARPFPGELRDGLALRQETPSPLPLPVGLLGMGVMLTMVGVHRNVKKRRKHAGKRTDA